MTGRAAEAATRLRVHRAATVAAALPAGVLAAVVAYQAFWVLSLL